MVVWTDTELTFTVQGLADAGHGDTFNSEYYNIPSEFIEDPRDESK